MLFSRSVILLIFLVFCGSISNASDLTIENSILFKENNRLYCLVDITWENAWRNKKNYDAAWVFFKFVSKNHSGYKHALIHPDESKVVSSNTPITIDVALDSVGLYLFSSDEFRGNVSARIQVTLDDEKLGNYRIRDAIFSAYGIEMVQIPKGAYWIGDIDTIAVAHGAFFMSDGFGDPACFFQVKLEESQIAINANAGSLYYQALRGIEGDQKGIITETFPKGVNSFYLMKYEPLQRQYVEFLNSLSVNQSQDRINFGGKNYYEERGSIRIENNRFVADKPDQPCGFLSWDDSMAFADWAGLRPITELEFTKASRGTKKPIPSEFAWGTTSKANLKRIILPNGKLGTIDNLDESQLSDENLEQFGASYYWVMELSGSLWERTITIGDEKGRAFKGSNGDGTLTSYGYATNDDWPRGNLETGGYGLRGGGFYSHGMDYRLYFPYSPISYRRYGGWSGGYRKAAYGIRLGRSSKK